MAVPLEYAFVFICQRGDLEIKAMLLAASLRRFVRCPHELIAALPQPETHFGRPEPETLAMLRGLEVRLVPITNAVDLTYPIANKLSAMCVETPAKRLIFLDSDMLCVRPFTGDPRLEVPFAAKLADRRSWGSNEGSWAAAYATLGLEPPATHFRTTETGETTLPYYNAGVVVAETALKFGETWLSCAQAIDANPAVENKRPWLDQIAIPVAMTQLGLPYAPLDPTFNYPAHLKPLSPLETPTFCHYHHPRVLKREPLLRQLVQDLCGQHPTLRRRMMARFDWRSPLTVGPGLLELQLAAKALRRRAIPAGSRRQQMVSALARGVRGLKGRGR